MSLEKPGPSNTRQKFVTQKQEKDLLRGFTEKFYVPKFDNDEFRDDRDYVSGFKNQGPFYQEATKLSGGDVYCPIGKDNEICSVMTARIV